MEDNKEYDFGEDVDAAPSKDSIKQLGSLSVTMAKLLLEQEELEDRLKEVKKQVRKYQEDFVPEVMAEIGLKSVVTAGGMQIDVKEHVRASFPKDLQKRESAFKYLKDSGNDGLVKREFAIKFGRDSEVEAEHFARALEEMELDKASIESGWNINHQTLLKFLREELKSGAPVPLEAFGAFVQKIASIKRG